MVTFQEILKRLSSFWEAQGCIIQQGYDLEVGAGTFNPATFLRCLGPEPYKAAYIEPCRRPSDGRYGTNPNRVQHYFQYQVILKPSPPNIQDLYLESLKAVGFKLEDHDIRFVHDDWESPTLGASGLGWEVWMDGMEITQFTYFQTAAGLELRPITGEITIGLERLAMYLQKVDNIFDLKWNDHITYGDIYLNNEIEWSHYNFEHASTDMWFRHFADYENEAKKILSLGLPIPAYDFVMKASHAFNLLDARGAISVTERTGYITRIRDLAKQTADIYIKSRKKLGFPLLRSSSTSEDHNEVPAIHSELLHFSPADNEDFLLEIGSEELPALFVPLGMQNLEKNVRALLQEEKIPFKSIKTYGTPRRLSIYIEDLALGKPEQSQEKRGPAIDQVFDEHGKLRPAGEGFFRSIDKHAPSLESIRKGSDPALSIKKIKDVDYLYALVTTPGSSTAQLLAEKLPKIILKLEFPKKMRWGDLEITYARPLRWVVSLFGHHVVPFAIDDIVADRISWGHRQLRPFNFSLVKAEDYVPILKEHLVMVDVIERKQHILMQLDALEKKLKSTIISREQVIPQVLNLVEWPQVTYAEFDRSFLKVPKEVLISEMVEHQKYFPVTDDKDNLINLFIITADNTPTDYIRKGNQKVLSARLSDGVFLYEQGLKHKLEKYNEKLKTVTFQKELGSVFDKVKRIEKHAKVIQKQLQIGSLAKVERAALLSKADLATEMVFEFPELQGTIGKYYAIASGEDPEVAEALDEQWMPRGENAPLPKTATGIILSLSDKIDNILGCYCANMKPTSSSDPYALRRQTLGIVKMLIANKYRLPLLQTLGQCLDHYPAHLLKEKAALLKEVEGFVTNRIKTVFLDYGFTKDEIDAALAIGFSDVYDAFCKVDALRQFRSNGDQFSQLFEVYKRAKGQLANRKEMPFTSTFLHEPAEKNLDLVLTTTQPKFDQAIRSHDYENAYTLVAQLQNPLATLFEQVKILADDPALRDNRIALLQRVFKLFGQLLDFSKIQEKE